MVATLLDGKALAARLRLELQKKIQKLSIPPHLYVLLSHSNPASELYVRTKQKACNEVGVKVTVDTTQYTDTQTLIKKIQALNQTPEIHAILIQLPLHPNINTDVVLETLDPSKDVDGLHPLSLGKLACGSRDSFIPCTPLGIFRLLQEYNIALSGKHVTILGRSRIVGTPLALLLSRPWPEANATITLAHSKTKNMKEICQASDIVISAVGKPSLLTQDMIREGAVVVDVGMNHIPHPAAPGKLLLVGDCDFDGLYQKASFITPVPGGIGPMTIISLLENSYQAAVRSL